MGHSTPTFPTFSRTPRARGFTLVEVLIAAGVLAFFIVTSVTAMAQINRWATAARLRTLALALAQQKADEILSTSWSVLSPTPPTVLTAGTITENNLPIDNDSFNNATGLSSVFSSLDTPINGMRTTTITSVSARQVRATVTVTYAYRSHNYSVSMNTLRSSDDF